MPRLSVLREGDGMSPERRLLAVVAGAVLLAGCLGTPEQRIGHDCPPPPSDDHCKRALAYQECGDDAIKMVGTNTAKAYYEAGRAEQERCSS